VTERDSAGGGGEGEEGKEVVGATANDVREDSTVEHQTYGGWEASLRHDGVAIRAWAGETLHNDQRRRGRYTGIIETVGNILGGGVAALADIGVRTRVRMLYEYRHLLLLDLVSF
jgi:hypothetical protein